jgi:hypothetical protein
MFGHKFFESTFKNVKLEEYLKKTFDKPRYFLNTKKDFLPTDYRRYLNFASTRQFASLMQKFGIGNNVDDFFYLLNIVKRKLRKKGYKFNRNKYAYVEENLSNHVKSNANEIAEKVANYLSDYFNEIKEETNKEYSEVYDHKQREELLVKALFAYYSIDNNLHYYIEYKEDFFDYEQRYFEIEKSLKLDKAFSSPAVWTGIMALESTYNTFSSLDDLFRLNTFSDLTMSLKSKLANKALDDMTDTLNYFEIIQKEFEKQFYQGDIVLTLAGEVGSTIATQYIVSILARSSLFIANLLPQARVLNVTKTGLQALAIFMQRSFISNFAFQINVEWKLDGYIQEIVRPYIKKLFDVEVFEEEQKAKVRLYYNLSRHFVLCENGFKSSCEALQKLGYTREKLLNELTEVFDLQSAQRFMTNIDLAYIRYKYLKDLINAKKEVRRDLHKTLLDLRNEILKKDTSELFLDNNKIFEITKDIIGKSLDIAKINAKIENYKKLSTASSYQEFGEDSIFGGFGYRSTSGDCAIADNVYYRAGKAYERINKTNSYLQFDKRILYRTKNNGVAGNIALNLYQDNNTFRYYYYHCTPFYEVPSDEFDVTSYYIYKKNAKDSKVTNSENVKFNTAYKVLAKALFSFVPIVDAILTPELVVVKFANNIKKYVYLDLENLNYIALYNDGSYKSYTLIDAKTNINLTLNKEDTFSHYYNDTHYAITSVVTDNDDYFTVCADKKSDIDLYRSYSISSSLSKSKNCSFYISFYDGHTTISIYRSNSLNYSKSNSEADNNSFYYKYYSEQISLSESIDFTYKGKELVNKSFNSSYYLYRYDSEADESISTNDRTTFYKELKYDRE